MSELNNVIDLTREKSIAGDFKTAGVVIDDWKLPIFKRHLESSGYSYSEHSGLQGTLILRVKYQWLRELKPVIEAANEECKI